MRIAIVESGGKQYRAIEGSTIDVDRLAFEVGKKFDFERVLLMADEDIVMVGTPTVGEIIVSATVVDHVKGPKVTSFKYRPKKRIRVKGGHRHFYTRLMIDFIGKAGEERKAKVEKEVVVVADAPAEVVEEPKVEKQKKASSKEMVKKPAATKTAPKSSTTTKKTVSKKTDKK
ncbi:MAG: 50S ribosomal protein L21 [Chloroflexi bacterium]|nr:50S ribosomal protein L21 [Chloroflexota bacterium]